MEEKYEKIDLNFLVLDFSTSYIETKLRQAEESNQVNLEEKTIEASQFSKKLDKNKNKSTKVSANNKNLDPISIMKQKAEKTKKLMKNFKELKDLMLCYSTNTVNSDERRKNFTLNKEDFSINFFISKKLTKEFNLDFFKDRFIAEKKFNAICVLDNEQDIKTSFSDQYENYRQYYNNCLLKTTEFFNGKSKQIMVFILREIIEEGVFNEVSNEDGLFIIPLHLKGLKNINIVNERMNAKIEIVKFIDYILKGKVDLESNINPYFCPKIKVNEKVIKNKIQNISSKNNLKLKKDDKNITLRSNNNNDNNKDLINNLNVDKIVSREINLHENDYENNNLEEELIMQKQQSDYLEGKKTNSHKIKPIRKVSGSSIYNLFKEKKYFKTPYQVYNFSFKPDIKEKKSNKKVLKNEKPKNSVKENKPINDATKKIQVSNIIKMGNDLTNHFFLIGCSKGCFIKVNILFEILQELSYSKYVSAKVNSGSNTNNIELNDENLPGILELMTPFTLSFTLERKKILLLSLNSNNTNYQVEMIGKHDQVIQLKKLSETYLASLSHFACIKVFNIARKEQVKYYKLYSMIEARNCFFELNLEYFIYTDIEYTKIFDINQDKIIDSFKNITPVVFFSKVNPYLNVFIQINFDATYTLLSVDYTKNKRYLSTNYFSKEVFFSLDKLEKGKGYDFSFDIDLKLLKTAYLEMHQLFLVNTGRAVIINHFYFEEQIPRLKFLCFLRFETPIYNWILDNHFAIILGENYFEENRSVNFESIIL